MPWGVYKLSRIINSPHIYTNYAFGASKHSVFMHMLDTAVYSCTQKRMERDETRGRWQGNNQRMKWGVDSEYHNHH